jgi:signal transduction histidine kinase
MSQHLKEPPNLQEGDVTGASVALAETVSTHLELDALLPAILELTSRVLPCHGCALSLWDDDRSCFLPAAAHGLPPRLERLFFRKPVSPGDIPLLDEVLRRREPVIASGADPLVPQALTKRIARSYRAASPGIVRPLAEDDYIGVPLLNRGRVTGALMLATDRHGFSSREVALINIIAPQIAAAIAVAQVLETERRRRSELETLHEMIALLEPELEMDKLFRLIVERAVYTFSAAAAALYIWDELEETIPPVAVHGLSSEFEQRQRLPADVLRTELGADPPLKPFVVSNLRPSPLIDPELITGENLHFVLAIPLQRGERFLGLVEVFYRTQRKTFDASALDLAQAFAKQSAIGLENARLYQHYQERSRQLTEVLATGNALRVNEDPSSILERIAEGIKRGLGWRAVLITRYDHAAGLAFGVASAGIPQEAFKRLYCPSPLEHRRHLYEKQRYRISRSFFVPAEDGGAVIANMSNSWVGPHASYCGTRQSSATAEPQSITPQVGKSQSRTHTPALRALPDSTDKPTSRWQSQDFMIVPIQGHSGQTLGTISTDLPLSGRRPGLADVQALEIFADQAAVALENARLFRLEQRRATELRGLAEIAAAFGALNDLNETYRRVTATVSRLLTAEICLALRFSTNMKWAWVETPAYGLAEHVLQNFRFPVTSEITKLMEAPGGEALLVDDVQTLPPPLDEHSRRLGFRNAALAFSYLRDRTTGMLMVANKPGGFTETDADLLLTVAHQAAIAIENAQLFTALNAERGRLRALSGRLTQAQEAERTRIARELHDEAGQALTTVRLQMDYVASILPPDVPSEVQDQINEAQTLIARTLEEIRRISIDLRPSILDDLGLTSALRWQCDRLQRHAKISVHFDSHQDGRRLKPDIETTVYRTAQEALTNIARHAQATSVEVKLDVTRDLLSLEIVDDGTGFNETADQERGLGLLGMQERLSAVSGTLQIESEPGVGSTLHIQVPV